MLAADGLLVIAHGARMEGWNERVIRMADRVEWVGPKGVAFLSPRTPDQELANVAARLEKAGAKRIVIVPLLVSSFSDHYEEIRYYGRDRKDAPPHHEHGPLTTRAELLVSPAMDSDRLLGRILADQIRSVSRDASRESVMLVAHGPNDEADNERWMGVPEGAGGVPAKGARLQTGGCRDDSRRRPEGSEGRSHRRDARAGEALWRRFEGAGCCRC